MSVAYSPVRRVVRVYLCLLAVEDCPELEDAKLLLMGITTTTAREAKEFLVERKVQPHAMAVIRTGVSSAKAMILVVLAMIVIAAFEAVGANAQEAPAPGPAALAPESGSPGSLLSSALFPAVVAVLSALAAIAF
ncbi:hypothetical protein R1sor_013500 [Riccia sorocarpa]|uniref:Uncharacterized protein n=1 Tax=Riccia sorocarpa TaxID=122646 RepID=A0ABD3HAU4_9MARC